MLDLNNCVTTSVDHRYHDMSNWILFGLFSEDNVDDNILVNYIILESKYLIFRSKLSKTFPTIALLISKCKTTHQIERFIARKNNTEFHFYNEK